MIPDAPKISLLDVIYALKHKSDNLLIILWQEKKSSVSWEYIYDNLDLQWNWKELSRAPFIKWDTIVNNLWAPWIPEMVSWNINITISIIREHPFGPDIELVPEWKWNMEAISSKVDWDTVVRSPDGLYSQDNIFIGAWDWRGLSRNINVTMRIIEDHPLCPWDWDAISINPNLTFEDLINHQKKDWKLYLKYN